jgi:uncharacterized membrane protein
VGTVSQAKTLGGVGSILVILTAVPGLGGILGIVGFILILVAIKYISDAVGDKSIFNNMLISVILSIVGVVVAAFVVIGSVLSFIGLNNLSAFRFGQSFNPSTVPAGDWVGLILSVLAGLVVLWIAFIVSAVFLRKTYDSVATRLNVSMFRTAALVYLIGAVTTIVLVGFILLFVAQILLIVAFFSIDEKAPVAPAPMGPGQPSPPAM